MKKTCDNCANVSTSVCDNCWTSDNAPYWKPASNYIPETRIERLRSMNDEEFVNWLVKTQFSWVKEIYSEFGVKFEYNDEQVKEATMEIHEWLLEFVEEA